MLNTTECCHAIGCNCGGTAMAEVMQSVPAWIYPAIVLGVFGILFFIVWKTTRSIPDP